MRGIPHRNHADSGCFCFCHGQFNRFHSAELSHGKMRIDQGADRSLFHDFHFRFRICAAAGQVFMIIPEPLHPMAFYAEQVCQDQYICNPGRLLPVKPFCFKNPLQESTEVLFRHFNVHPLPSDTAYIPAGPSDQKNRKPS